MQAVRAWKCEVCGYVHEGPEPPANCPVCGVDRELFAPLDVPAPPPPVAARRWRCTICDHVHEGDEPPERCPVCGADREYFDPLADAADGPRPSADIERLVIVGGGIAGLTAAEHARRTAPDVRITMVTAEPGLPYYRLNLTRYLAGEVDVADLLIQGDPWFAERRIERVEARATAIDPDHKRVALGSDELPYDRLILADGAHAFVPPIPGIDLEGVHPFRSLVDARRILQQAQPGMKVAVLGGGLLGLETAGALAGCGCDVRVLEGYGWLLPRQLTETGGRLVMEHVRARGIEVVSDVFAEAFVGDGRVRKVRIGDDRELDADLVVLATGIRPNTALARRAGLTVKGGVIVDDRLRTSAGSVLAAGDGTEHRGRVYGIWPASFAQGAVAGVNAVGGDAEFRGIPPANTLKVLDVDVFSIGRFEDPDGSYQVHERVEGGTYARVVCRDGRILGANLVGDTGLAGAVREAVDSGVQVAERPDLAALIDGLREA